MSTFDPVDELARIAHELWRTRMVSRGWSHGPRYDEAQRTHDALVPYAGLCPRDREEARLSIGALGLEKVLADEIDYPRGPERPLTLEEMRAGLPVTYAKDLEVEEGGRPGPMERGVVESWETDPTSGDLKCVRVRWADGLLSAHMPAERDLRRIE